MEVIYTKPEPGGQLYDHDNRSERRSITGKSMMSTVTSMSRTHANETDLLEDKEYVLRMWFFIVQQCYLLF